MVIRGCLSVKTSEKKPVCSFAFFRITPIMLQTLKKKCVSLRAQEQTSMAKLGLELRLLSSDVDSEVEKWEEQEHDIVRQSQSMASMAYNMYLFTR